MAPASVNMRRARPLLGTFVEICVSGSAGPEVAEKGIEAAFAAVEKTHRLMSFHDPDSDVSRLNREAGSRAVAVDEWTFQVLETALDLHRRSGGTFDIAVAPALQRMGLLPCLQGETPLSWPDLIGPSRATDNDFDALSGWPGRSPAMTMGAVETFGARHEMKSAIELLPRRRVRFGAAGVRIDLGGIAKGFAVDRAIDALLAHGVPAGSVNAGGDLAAFGPEPAAVDIRDPRDPRLSLCRIEVRNEALATTAGYFDPARSFEVSHSAVIDPATQGVARAICGATVRAPSCMLADALTKAVMIGGRAASSVLEHCGASALFMLADGSVQISADWEGSVRRAA